MKNDCTHIFVCVNKKGKGKCCAMFNSESIYECLREELNRNRETLMLKGFKRIKAVKTSCLGQCALGPNVFFPSENMWYTLLSPECVLEFVNIHLIKGEKVDRLINKEIHPDVAETI